jgi:hypothetical protein
MCKRPPALSRADLAAWLNSDLLANVDAMIDLIASGDIVIVSLLDEFTVAAGHDGPVRFGREITLPMMAPAFG